MELSTTSNSILPMAMRRDPSIAGPQPGETTGARPLDYATDVQPVWDAHCIECHNESRNEGDLDLTGKKTKLFSVSYEQLMDRRMIPIIGENHPKAGNNHYLPPYSLGAHASKLMDYLQSDHYEVSLSPEERIKVTTWIDSNGQYYGSYYGRKNLKYADHPNFRRSFTFKQSQANEPPVPETKR
jgi:hypothetical protein